MLYIELYSKFKASIVFKNQMNIILINLRIINKHAKFIIIFSLRI
jgi:hypothetical protein